MLIGGSSCNLNKMQHRKTPWKKSRTFGDVYGGRERRRFSDNIFARAHSLQSPSPDEDLPILIEENPSRDFFFPLSGAEVVEALKSLPRRDHQDITHVWMRRLRKSDYLANTAPYATFSCGSGVHLITMYPFPRDLRFSFGPRRPSNAGLNDARLFGAQIRRTGKNWTAVWTLPALRKFYLHILYHEVGHHVDWFDRHWSAANGRELEEAAEQYAYAKTATAQHVFNRLNKRIDDRTG